ncbi:Uracil-DNA glycosylase [Dissostichus eleginoides]|uniref:Uracil-DNA glycosylase n=1 Tax=Dissostichus eleginoides TaxID=100907 RepID=A0AAD9F3Q3_DISEL|nr:Uracil-DNA glycosylase [Dissostichus eleginoides]
MITCAFLWVGFFVAVDSTMVNYQKYITVMQLALGVTASNKEHCLPPRKHMWIHPQHPSPTAGSITGASSVSTIQGKPSLRRIKGRIHRSKSLDSLDLLDSNSAVDRGTLPLTSTKKSPSGRLERDGSRVLKAWRWKPDLSETHHKACGKRRRGRGSRARGVTSLGEGCEEGVADVEYISGGSDSGALAAYVSSDETYGRSSNEICGKSPYISNIAGPLCSSSITFSPYLLLRSLVPEVEVTRTVTQSQSDKMHK